MQQRTTRRGLQDIRTVAGRATSPGAKQRDYLRLCTLEMERARREQEYTVAHDRAEAAKRRVDRLQTEINEMIAKIGGPPAAKAEPVIADESIVLEHKYGGGLRSPAKKGARA